MYRNITPANPITNPHRCREPCVRRNAATTIPALKIHASALAMVARPNVRPAQNPPRRGHAHKPNRQRATPIGSSIPEASFITLVGRTIAIRAAASPT